MGGGPVTKNFRGADVDPLTYDFLVDLAANSGSIYIDPIDGYGSYRSNESSAGTDTGGGHVDINAVNMTDAEARFVETLARMRGGCAFFRPRTWYSPSRQRWITPGWQRHVHVLLMGVPDLSDAALAQIREYKAGGDGLVGSDPDTGNRNYINMTWQKYLAIKEAEEVSAQDVWSFPMGVNPADSSVKSNAQNALEIARNYSFRGWALAYDTNKKVSELLGKDFVDEAAIAKELLDGITEPLKEVVASVLASAPVGATPEAIAEVVAKELAGRLVD